LITLPLILNKAKLQHKFSMGQLGDLELTEKQRRLAGIFKDSSTSSKPVIKRESVLT